MLEIHWRHGEIGVHLDLLEVEPGKLLGVVLEICHLIHHRVDHHLLLGLGSQYLFINFVFP